MATDEFVLSFDAFLRSFKCSIKSPFAFLLGAGASITSEVPAATDCIWEWKRLIYLSNNPQDASHLSIYSEFCKRKIQCWLDAQGEYPKEGAEDEYVFYAEKAFPLEDDRRRFFESISSNKTPYVGYRLLCLLNKYGVLRSVWSTNLDGLVERAAHMMNLTPIAINLDDPDRINRFPENSSELPYIALHGDYKYSRLKNTSKELDSQDEIFEEKLQTYFRDRNLIVIGYSGRDKSLMKALANAFTKNGSGRLYWCGYGTTITDEVKCLIRAIKKSGREARYVATSGFDDVMISLMLNAYGDDLEKYKEISKYLALIRPNNCNTPFRVKSSTYSRFVRSNLVPLIVPSDVYQFSVPVPNVMTPWQFVKDKVMGTNIMAVPYNNSIYAYGYSDDIQNAFAVSDINRVPLPLSGLLCNGTLLRLVRNTLICNLASVSKLKANLHSRMLWDSEKMYKRGGVFEGVKIDILYTPSEKFLLVSLCPTLYFDKGTDLDAQQKKELISSYLDPKRNMNYNAMLDLWVAKIFRHGHLKFDYPLGSHNHFFFQISNTTGRIAIDAGNQYRNKVELTNDTLFKGVQIEEPSLSFYNPISRGYSNDTNPMRGLIKYSPYDKRIQDSYNEDIQLGVICPSTKTRLFEGFLAKLNEETKPAVGSDYLQNYKGFDDIYKCNLRIPDSRSVNWISCHEEQTDSIQLVRNICSHAHILAERVPGIIVLIFVPTSWSKHRSFHRDGEMFDFHNYIKAYAAEHGFATQIVEEKTVFNRAMTCNIVWWLSLAIYVKSMRTPWALDCLDKSTAYAGIGYSLKKDGSGNNYVVVGCSHIYNSEGYGLKYKLGKVDNPIIDNKKNPYLHYEEAYKLGMSIVEQFRKSMDDMPKRVVIHKRTPFSDDEIKGITESLTQAKIKEIDLISITVETKIKGLNLDLYSGKFIADRFPVRRGTCFPINDSTFLLWTHGAVDSIINGRSYYVGGRGIPSSLRVTKHYGNGDICTIAKEVLGFTKMNWNSFNMYTKLPATIDTSNTLARVGNLLPDVDDIVYDYRFFI